MAISVKNFSDMARKDVFTSKGIYCGKIVDIGLDFEKFRVKSVVVDAVRGSHFASIVGDKKGVVVPYAMVQSVGDIVLIKHVPLASVEAETEEAPVEA
jgi:sporulation protein YlmC with PRC-barrel domain